MLNQDKPGQALLHSILCCWSPWQPSPPLSGVGLEQVRVLRLYEQLDMQSDHTLHDDQPPFTDHIHIDMIQVKINYIKKLLNILMCMRNLLNYAHKGCLMTIALNLVICRMVM